MADPWQRPADPVFEPAPDSAAPGPAAPAVMLAARRAFNADRRDEALAHAWHAVELAPRDPDALDLLGRILTACGHPEEAREVLTEALRLAPEHVGAQRSLGALYASTGDLSRAEEHWQRAVLLDHTHVDTLRRLGWLLHDTERLDRAEAIARLAVKVGPDDALAHHLLGSILRRCDRLDEARAVIERAVALAPDFSPAVRALAELEVILGVGAQAESLLRGALRQSPDDPELHRTLAWVLLCQRQFDDAHDAIRRALALAPDHLRARAQLGWILLERKEYDAVVGQAVEILAQRPDAPDAELLIAESHFRRHEFDAAEDWLRRAVEHGPRFAPAFGRLGALLLQRHHVAEAEKLLRAAIDIDSRYTGAYRELAMLLERQGRFIEAERALCTLLDRVPHDALGWCALGRLLDNAQRDDEAVDALTRAVALDETLKDAWVQLLRLAVRGASAAQRTLAALDRDALYDHLADLTDRATGWLSFDEYHQIIARALTVFPDDDLFEAARQFALTYDPAQTQASLRGEADKFGQRVPPRPMARRGAVRRPRVAYVGSHLHPELMDGYIGHHDHDRFDIMLFGNDDPERLPHRDRRLRAYRLDDIDLARACAAMEIDLVIDIVGPYPRASLLEPYLALRERVAPVQCLWLNTFATTGNPAYDYVIADSCLIRPDEERWFSERVLRLPHCQWFWSPPDERPAPGPLPALANGHVTLGSANRGLKLNDDVLHTWAAAIARLPEARLRLVGWYTDGWQLRRRILGIMAEHGVGIERIDFLHAFEKERLWDFYQGIDLALDSFPFNGGLTTFEALWMGVPVVAMAGQRFTARQTEDILGVLDLKHWVADDRDGFVELVARLAGDLGQLAAARAHLRNRMRASPLCDGPRFARDLEALFLDMLAGR